MNDVQWRILCSKLHYHRKKEWVGILTPVEICFLVEVCGVRMSDYNEQTYNRATLDRANGCSGLRKFYFFPSDDLIKSIKETKL